MRYGHPWFGGVGELPTSFYSKPVRKVKDIIPPPETGDAAQDGYTVIARHAPWGAPGDFTSVKEAARYDDMSPEPYNDA